MLGFATVDNGGSTGVTVVWLTSRVQPNRAEHTNAVTLYAADEDCENKFQALVADRLLVLTQGSIAPEWLPSAKTVEAIDGWVEYTAARQDQICAAIAMRSTNLVQPTFPTRPSMDDINISVELADQVKRTLITATYVARTWTAWLETEQQRLKRTVDPKTGATPWIMPANLSGPRDEVPALVTSGAR